MFYTERYINYVEIIFRESTSTGWGNWKKAGTLDWVDIYNDNSFEFYNEGNYEEVDQDEVARQYQNLPITAKAQVPLDKRIGYIGVKEGRNDIIPNVVLSEQYIEQEIPKQGSTINHTYIITENFTTSGGVTTYDYEIAVPAGLPTAGYLFEIIIGTEKATFTIPSTYSVITDYTSGIATFIQNNFNDVATVSSDASNVYFTMNSEQLSYDPIVFAYLYVNAVVDYQVVPGFKLGAKHRFCIFYYDALMRRGNAIESNDLEVYLPTIMEQSAYSPSDADIIRYNIGWTIKHLPPTWATHWRFGYTGNTTIDKFWQYSITHIKDTGDSGRYYGTGAAEYPQYEEFVEICIDPLQYHKDESYAQSTLEYSFPNSEIDLYEFQAGDRVRFMASVTQATGDVTYMTSVYDYEIKAYDESGGSGTAACIFIEDINVSVVGLGAHGIIEIYRPYKTSEDTVYYEYGPIMSTYTSSGVLYHRGLTQDQDASNDATGTFTAGDVYHIQRLFSDPIHAGNVDTFTVESYSPSDFYKADVWSQGKIGIASPIGQTESNKILFSNVMLESTKINGLSDFDFNNYAEVTNLYGDVNAARVLGSRLKMITDSVVITAGLGIREIQDASGNISYATSDSVVGYQRVSSNHHGTINPESVRVVDGALYFWDYKNGCVVRDSGNGLFPISGRYPTATGWTDHKMRTFFRQMKETIRANTYTDWLVWSGYERNYDLLYFYFKDTTDATNNVIISYQVSTGRWFCNNHIWSNSSGTWPYYIGGGGRFFSSTIGEDIYKHFSDSSNYCTYYSDAKPFELRIYTSEGNSEVKLYDRFGIQASDKPAVNDIRVTTVEDVDGIMISQIPANYIEKIENGWYAPFLRNMATYHDTVLNTDTEMITGWTEVSGKEFDTAFTSSGANITAAQESGGDEAAAYTNASSPFTLYKNVTYIVTTNLTNSLGYDLPNLYYGASFAGKILIGGVASGSSFMTFTPSSDISSAYLYIVNEDGYSCDFSCTFSLKVSPTTYSLGLIKGDYLRGNSLRLDLDYTTATSEITVFKVVIGSELSNI